MQHRIRLVAPNVQQKAQELRRTLTSSEKSLWIHLKGRQLAGYKFRRQFPVGITILDFCAPSVKLGIELDGEIHSTQQEHDLLRTEYLNSMGYTIVRFDNTQIEQNIESVLEQIHLAILELPTKQAR